MPSTAAADACSAHPQSRDTVMVDARQRPPPRRVLASTVCSLPASPRPHATTASPTSLTATTGSLPMPTSSAAPQRGAAAGRPAACSTREPPGRRTLQETRAAPEPPSAMPGADVSWSDISTGRSKLPATVRDAMMRSPSSQAASAPLPGLSASAGARGPASTGAPPGSPTRRRPASAVASRTWNAPSRPSTQAAVGRPRRSSATSRSCTAAPASPTRPGRQAPARAAPHGRHDGAPSDPRRHRVAARVQRHVREGRAGPREDPRAAPPAAGGPRRGLHPPRVGGRAGGDADPGGQRRPVGPRRDRDAEP